MPKLGGNQSVAQAVVVPQEKFDPNKAPMVVSLFKPDGAPYLADTATVYSVMMVFAQELGPNAYELVRAGNIPGPYGARVMFVKQQDPKENGVFKVMSGAPNTVGPVPMVKLSDLPKGDAVIGCLAIVGDPSSMAPLETSGVDDIFAAVQQPDAASGGFLFGSVAVGEDEAGQPSYIWECIYNGANIASLEARLSALEG